jgi:hypothetical protein
MDQARQRLAFGALCALGLIAHLTFLFVYAGLVAWTFARRDAAWRLRAWIELHLLPVVTINGVYLLDARALEYGGGPPFSVGEVIGRGLSLLAGGPASGTLQIAAAAALVLVVAYGFVVVAKQRRDEAVFFAATLVLAPAAVLAVYPAPYLEVRYFYVLFPFVWLLAARALARLAGAGSLGRVCTALLVALSFAGNVANTAPLLRDGRGHYMEIVSTMAQLTANKTITVGSDHDFRNRLVLSYYAERLPFDRRLVYIPYNSRTGTNPEWIVTHDLGAPRSEPAVHVSGYVPIRCLPYGGISGWNWCLHRLASPKP